jgi:hypothetical protein
MFRCFEANILLKGSVLRIPYTNNDTDDIINLADLNHFKLI